jgi:hypothetical protein
VPCRSGQGQQWVLEADDLAVSLAGIDDMTCSRTLACARLTAACTRQAGSAAYDRQRVHVAWPLARHACGSVRGALP